MSEDRQWVWFFGDALPDGSGDPKALLGGKGASLAEMSRAGLHVPPGFTISTEACRFFFENGEKWPPDLERQVRRNLERLEQATGRTFGRGASPLLVSVRSGAAVSMPGMMDTILNCGIHTGLADEVGEAPDFWRPFVQFVEMFARTVADVDFQDFPAAGEPSREAADRYLKHYENETGRLFPLDPWEQLIECINAVFRSWNNDRALAYRRRNNIRGLTGTAVNIQAMFPSRVSGILFTQDPNDLAADRMILESSFGLGEAVVSGDVSPDRFRVARSDRSRVESTIGKKTHAFAALGDKLDFDHDAPSLSAGQIAELCELAARIEEHFGAPMDIEWGWADGRFALLQCRPIGGLEVSRDVETARRSEIARLRQLAAGKPRYWVTHNLGETLRSPTPLTWDIIRHYMSGSGGYGGTFREIGYRPSSEVCETGFLELICGRIYADPDRVAQLYWGDSPMKHDREVVTRDPTQLENTPALFDVNKVDTPFLLSLPGLIRDMLRGMKTLKRAVTNAKSRFDNAVVPPLLEYTAAKRTQDLSVLSTAEVIIELDERRARVLDDFGKETFKMTFFSGLAFNDLEGMLVKLMGKEAGTQMSSMLTMGLEGDVTFEQDALLSRVAAGEVSMENFLERFGHRAAGEMELAEPRWREDPAYLHQIVDRLRLSGGRSMSDVHLENARKREAAEAGLPNVLAEWGGSSFLEDIRKNLHDAQQLLPYRESAKNFLMMGYELIRLAILELGRRWGLDGDVFFLHLDELAEFETRRQELTAAIKKRRIRWQAFQRLDMADVVDSESLDDLGLAPELEAANELNGESIASGVAIGPARIVTDPAKTGELGAGYILVCPSTDPGWTPLFLNARGLVVERGGILSHGAIVARDFGIPAVVCHNATRLIQPGDTVRLDGNRGHISIVEGDSANRNRGALPAAGRSNRAPQD